MYMYVVLTTMEQDDTEAMALFSNKKDAEQFAKAFESSFSWTQVVELELDRMVMPTGHLPFYIEMTEFRKAVTVQKQRIPYFTPNQIRITKHIMTNNLGPDRDPVSVFSGIIFAPSSVEAVAKMKDLVRSIMANRDWKTYRRVDYNYRIITRVVAIDE